ncbi:hypothetical protein Q3G72_017592 [Acer saccharum]|nr:hypothetical protein Q3G72_017592 [Acer saccharum]
MTWLYEYNSISLSSAVDNSSDMAWLVGSNKSNSKHNEKCDIRMENCILLVMLLEMDKGSDGNWEKHGYKHCHGCISRRHSQRILNALVISGTINYAAVAAPSVRSFSVLL